MLYQDVIDGDLCETFLALDAKRQKSIAEELDRTPGTRTKYKKRLEPDKLPLNLPLLSAGVGLCNVANVQEVWLTLCSSAVVA